MFGGAVPSGFGQPRVQQSDKSAVSTTAGSGTSTNIFGSGLLPSNLTINQAKFHQRDPVLLADKFGPRGAAHFDGSARTSIGPPVSEDPALYHGYNVCKKCGTKFNSSEELRSHITIEKHQTSAASIGSFPKSLRAFQCHACSTEFSSYAEMMDHVKRENHFKPKVAEFALPATKLPGAKDILINKQLPAVEINPDLPPGVNFNFSTGSPSQQRLGPPDKQIIKPKLNIVSKASTLSPRESSTLVRNLVKPRTPPSSFTSSLTPSRGFFSGKEIAANTVMNMATSFETPIKPPDRTDQPLSAKQINVNELLAKEIASKEALKAKLKAKLQRELGQPGSSPPLVPANNSERFNHFDKNVLPTPLLSNKAMNDMDYKFDPPRSVLQSKATAPVKLPGNPANRMIDALSEVNTSTMTRSAPESSTDRNFDSGRPPDDTALCHDKCPESERDRRIREQLRDDTFEIPFPHLPMFSTPKDVMIKYFKRSAADIDLQFPELIRTPRALLATIRYIEEYIIDSSLGVTADGRIDERFVDCGVPTRCKEYVFIWDRYRMCFADFKLQKPHLGINRIWIECHERMIRWYIFMNYFMKIDELYMEAGHTQQNEEALSKAFTAAYGHYTSLFRDQVSMPNKGEVLGYFILFQIGNRGEISKFLQKLDHCDLNTQEVVFAVEVWKSVSTENYSKFFKLLRRANLLQACLMHKYVAEVRTRALHHLCRGCFAPGKFGVPTFLALEDVSRILLFNNIDEATEFVCYCGLEVEFGDDGSQEGPQIIIPTPHVHQLMPVDKRERPIYPITKRMGIIDEKQYRNSQKSLYSIKSICRGESSNSVMFDDLTCLNSQPSMVIRKASPSTKTAKQEPAMSMHMPSLQLQVPNFPTKDFHSTTKDAQKFPITPTSPFAKLSGEPVQDARKIAATIGDSNAKTLRKEATSGSQFTLSPSFNMTPQACVDSLNSFASAPTPPPLTSTILAKPFSISATNQTTSIISSIGPPFFSKAAAPNLSSNYTTESIVSAPPVESFTFTPANNFVSQAHPPSPLPPATNGDPVKVFDVIQTAQSNLTVSYPAFVSNVKSPITSASPLHSETAVPRTTSSIQNIQTERLPVAPLSIPVIAPDPWTQSTSSAQFAADALRRDRCEAQLVNYLNGRNWKRKSHVFTSWKRLLLQAELNVKGKVLNLFFHLWRIKFKNLLDRRRQLSQDIQLINVTWDAASSQTMGIESPTSQMRKKKRNKIQSLNIQQLHQKYQSIQPYYPLVSLLKSASSNNEVNSHQQLDICNIVGPNLYANQLRYLQSINQSSLEDDSQGCTSLLPSTLASLQWNQQLFWKLSICSLCERSCSWCCDDDFLTNSIRILLTNQIAPLGKLALHSSMVDCQTPLSDTLKRPLLRQVNISIADVCLDSYKKHGGSCYSQAHGLLIILPLTRVVSSDSFLSIAKQIARHLEVSVKNPIVMVFTNADKTPAHGVGEELQIDCQNADMEQLSHDIKIILQRILSTNALYPSPSDASFTNLDTQSKVYAMIQALMEKLILIMNDVESFIDALQDVIVVSCDTTRRPLDQGEGTFKEVTQEVMHLFDSVSVSKKSLQQCLTEAMVVLSSKALSTPIITRLHVYEWLKDATLPLFWIAPGSFNKNNISNKRPRGSASTNSSHMPSAAAVQLHGLIERVNRRLDECIHRLASTSQFSDDILEKMSSLSFLSEDFAVQNQQDGPLVIAGALFEDVAGSMTTKSVPIDFREKASRELVQSAIDMIECLKLPVPLVQVAESNDLLFSEYIQQLALLGWHVDSTKVISNREAMAPSFFRTLSGIFQRELDIWEQDATPLRQLYLELSDVPQNGIDDFLDDDERRLATQPCVDITSGEEDEEEGDDGEFTGYGFHQDGNNVPEGLKKPDLATAYLQNCLQLQQKIEGKHSTHQPLSKRAKLLLDNLLQDDGIVDEAGAITEDTTTDHSVVTLDEVCLESFDEEDMFDMLEMMKEESAAVGELNSFLSQLTN